MLHSQSTLIENTCEIKKSGAEENRIVWGSDFFSKASLKNDDLLKTESIKQFNAMDEQQHGNNDEITKYSLDLKIQQEAVPLRDPMNPWRYPKEIQQMFVKQLIRVIIPCYQLLGEDGEG